MLTNCEVLKKLTAGPMAKEKRDRSWVERQVRESPLPRTGNHRLDFRLYNTFPRHRLPCRMQSCLMWFSGT